MNTANLQLEGLCAAVGALMAALREKGALSTEEIDRALAETEARLADDPGRPSELSAAHVDAIRFPLRYLRLTNRLESEGQSLPFAELARRVGQEKHEP